MDYTHLEESSRIFEAILYMPRLRLDYLSKPRVLLTALGKYGFMDCTDPRERLFAFASLDSDYRIIPDYLKTMDQVCVEFAGMLVRRGELEFLFLRSQLVHPRTFCLDVQELKLSHHGSQTHAAQLRTRRDRAHIVPWC
jgi:hypothetical protein